MDGVEIVLWCLLSLGLASWVVWRALVMLLWRPLALTRSLARQGVRGPAGKFLYGSLEEIKAANAAARRVLLDVRSHDISSKVLPHYHTWSAQYALHLQEGGYLSSPYFTKKYVPSGSTNGKAWRTRC